MSSNSIYKEFKNMEWGELRDSSAVKNPNCSSTGCEFRSQHPHGSLKLYLISVLKALIISSDTTIHEDKTPIHIK